MVGENRKALQADEQFCSSCGDVIKKAAEICLNCGVCVKKEEYRKTRGVAVALALFFNYFSWLYTWKADKAKFIGVVLFLVIGGGVIAGFLGEDFEAIFEVSWLFGSIVIYVTWFWAIILALVRPQKFYKEYGNEFNLDLRGVITDESKKKNKEIRCPSCNGLVVKRVCQECEGYMCGCGISIGKDYNACPNCGSKKEIECK